MFSDDVPWTKKGDAIYSYVGQAVDVKLNSETESGFYYFAPSSTGTVTVKITKGENAVIYVTTANGKSVTATSGANGTGTVSFRATRNTNYYIEITNEKVCSFTIS